MKPSSALIESACRALANSPPASVAQLAAQAGLSTTHFHRLFKQHTGLSPKQYALAARAQRLRDGLTRSERVTDALFDAGFGSSSRFYEHSHSLLGMSARQFQRGAQRERIHFAVGECSLGSVLVAQTERGVCAILLGDHPEPLLEDLQRRFRHAELVGADAQFEHSIAMVIGLIDRPQQAVTLPMDIRGTAFQQRVWQALRRIAPGSTVTYAELAARCGVPTATRAVANACGANPLAVAIPCHRVVRSDGALGGYRWGLARKQQLLARESTPD